MNKENELIKVNDLIVNLKNVSNIVILNNRIVFNMNYTICIKTAYHDKFISDYVYWDSNVEINRDFLYSNKHIQDNFIIINKHLINKNEISTIKFLESQSRIIFNMSHPVTFKDRNGNKNLTSEFVYIDFDKTSEFLEAKHKIESVI